MRALYAVAAVIAVAPIAFARGSTLVTTYQEAGDKAYHEGRADEAEKMYRLAVKEAEKAGQRDGQLATILDDLARACQTQAKFSEAEQFYERSIALAEKLAGRSDAEFARALHNYAVLCLSQRKISKAETLFKQVIALAERSQPANYLLAPALANLGEVMDAQTKPSEGEALFDRSVSLTRTATKNADHPQLAARLDALAYHHLRFGRYAKAEQVGREALAMDERLANGGDSAEVAENLDLLADLAWRQNRFDDSESLATRAISMFERTQGNDHPNVAMAKDTLARLRLAEGKLDAALEAAQRANEIVKKLSKDHSLVRQTEGVLGEALVRLTRYEEAEPLLKHALAAYEKFVGVDNAQTAWVRSTLALLAFKRGKADEAEPLARRALQVREKLFGKEHAEVAESCERLAEILKAIGTSSAIAEAEELAARAKLIRARAGDAGAR